MLRQIRKLLLVIGFILFAIFLSACSENANLVDPDAIFSDKYDDELRVHFLYLNEQSEKTGESIFVQTPDGTSILIDRKSTRLNSSHVAISYAVFCLKKKTKK